MTLINDIEIDDIKYSENVIKKAIINNDMIEDKLHVVIVISNPCLSATRYILTKEFIRRMNEEERVILYVVELAYKNQNYYITKNNKKEHLRLYTDTLPLWHKENLINIGIKKLLPSDWKAVAWIDADIEFDSPTWASDTLKILSGSKDIIQLYSHCLFLDQDNNTEIIFTSMGYQYVTNNKRSTTLTDINSFWFPGFAWACTRKLYDKMGGLFEYAIGGDGDSQMASCFLNSYWTSIYDNTSEDYKNELRQFQKNVLNCRLGYTPGIIRHYYHGTISNRKYNDRPKMIAEYNFCPSIHVTRNKDGLLIPTDLFPQELSTKILSNISNSSNDSHLKKTTSIKYENKTINIINKKINIVEILQDNKLIDNNYSCSIINLKKDKLRHESTKEQLQFLSLNSYTLNATYWKERDEFIKDLKYVFSFLKNFNKNINEDITINLFSEVSDKNIKLQDGVLACFCSHLRIMINSYIKKENYTIISEDDILIKNTLNIEKYLKSIPKDWDIICFDSQPLENYYQEPFYKFTNSFYFLHFYIVNNKCLETIFKNIYPVTHQLDILIGNMHNVLNIYNITDTIIQNNFYTNIQNDLYTIYNLIPDNPLINKINNFENILLKNINSILTDNDIFNKFICDKIMFDVVFNNIINLTTFYNIAETKITNNNNKTDEEMALYNIFSHFLININDNVFSNILNNIKHIVNNFKLHNVIDNVYNEPYKAYNYGSTSNTYILTKNNVIIKKYNDKLRWTNSTHNNSLEIFNKEIFILNKFNKNNHLPKLIDFDNNNLLIKINYVGISLYDNFNLPTDWESQIKEIFNELNEVKIIYSEFNIKNITCSNNKLYFIDFGLCEYSDICDNTETCNIFIELLYILNDKFSNVPNINEQHILYNTFLNNMRLIPKYSSVIF